MWIELNEMEKVKITMRQLLLSDEFTIPVVARVSNVMSDILVDFLC